ncbi:MAG: helix-turn-helix transcriptional regulator [Candidatus Aminicenantes bacterium]|nr:MAG: helix-turn-helix transcriptional regulator [Candidatus Aminicenantes bacterium]
MNDILFFTLIPLSICAGLFAILITYQLQKKFRLNYLSTYLYFQIFITVFGIYGILGQLIAKRILQQQISALRMIETIGHFFAILGIPFLILAWYMFIRLCRELIEKKLSQTFTLSYFFILIFIFLGYGSVIILFNLSDYGDEQYVVLSSAISYLYIILEVLVLAIALSQLFIHTGKIKDENKRKAVRIFASLNLIVFCTGILLYLFVQQSHTLAALHLFVFLSGNILPLLYWRAYLKKHFIAPLPQQTNTLTWNQFLEEFKISRREEEVIRQLCEGKTNREISDALFISLQTVKDHVYRIYQKTDVKNRVQLINLIQSYKIK